MELRNGDTQLLAVMKKKKPVKYEIKETLHLDGTVCKKRKTAPYRSAIAFHWREKIFDLGLSMDWGEPCCWSCGFWKNLDSDSIVEDDSISLGEMFKGWDAHLYLERAHIIPRALGGCCCPGNLMLLCKFCHKDNPDTANKESFLQWVKNRKGLAPIIKRQYELRMVFEEFNLKVSMLNIVTFYRNKKFLDYVDSQSVKVRFEYTDATKASCLYEYKTQYNDSELINQIEDVSMREVLEKERKNDS